MRRIGFPSSRLIYVYGSALLVISFSVAGGMFLEHVAGKHLEQRSALQIERVMERLAAASRCEDAPLFVESVLDSVLEVDGVDLAALFDAQGRLQAARDVNGTSGEMRQRLEEFGRRNRTKELVREPRTERTDPQSRADLDQDAAGSPRRLARRARCSSPRRSRRGTPPRPCSRIRIWRGTLILGGIAFLVRLVGDASPSRGRFWTWPRAAEKVASGRTSRCRLGSALHRSGRTGDPLQRPRVRSSAGSGSARCPAKRRLEDIVTRQTRRLHSHVEHLRWHDQQRNLMFSSLSHEVRTRRSPTSARRWNCCPPTATTSPSWSTSSCR